MDYKTGTYKILANKEWKCEKCNEIIIKKESYFARVKVISEKEKLFKRYHFKCANELDNLNEYEKDLIYSHLNNKISENELTRKAYYIFLKQEKKNNLTFLRVAVGKFSDVNNTKYYKIGRKGFADYVVFFKKGKTLFIELKNTTSLNYNQKKFKEYVELLGYEYCIVKSTTELYNIIYRYI